MKEPIVFKTNSSWEELPTVKLQEMIKEQEWFKDCCKEEHLSMPYDQEYWDRFEKPHQSRDVPDLWLGIPYKNKSSKAIAINVHFEIRENHKGKEIPCFRIFLTTDINVGNTFEHHGERRTASSYDKAIDKIEELIEKGITYIDLGLETAKEWKIWAERMKKEMKKAAKGLGDLTLKESYSPERVEYNASESYGIGLAIPEGTANSDGGFEITEIRGIFSLEELKQIIRIVATNPRAVAERLLKNK